MTRIPPSQKIREAIGQFLANGFAGEADVAGTLLRLGAQRLIQELLEHEVTDFLRRDYYQRGDGQPHRGFRNGYKPGHIDSPRARFASPLRRRTKILPQFFDEHSCLKLVFATLARASQRWQRVRFSKLERKQLELLRLRLFPEPQPHTRPTETKASTAA